MDWITKNGQTALHMATAAVAGPALIWAGYVYPGSWKGKAFLSLTGVALLVSHYAYLEQDFRSRNAE
jgi:hypothetical protein